MDVQRFEKSSDGAGGLQVDLWALYLNGSL